MWKKYLLMDILFTKEEFFIFYFAENLFFTSKQLLNMTVK